MYDGSIPFLGHLLFAVNTWEAHVTDSIYIGTTGLGFLLSQVAARRYNEFIDNHGALKNVDGYRELPAAGLIDRVIVQRNCLLLNRTLRRLSRWR